MSDFIDHAGQEDWLNPDNWGLDDADWAAFEELAAAQAAAKMVRGSLPFATETDSQPRNEQDVETVFNCASTSGFYAAPFNSKPPRRKTNGGPKSKAREKLMLKCPHANCTHDRNFSRHYELERHIRVKHGDKKPYSCPFPGCYKGTAPPSYARADKLTSHIRNVHAKESNKLLDCYFPGCTRTALPIDLLGIHFWQAHSERPYGVLRILDEGARGIWHAASTARRQCPLWRCAKLLPLSLFMKHLLDHTPEELEEADETLRADGYYISHTTRSPSQLEHDDNYNAERDSSSLCVLVGCPLCKEAFGSHEHLWVHIDEEHLVEATQKAHFRAWRQCAKDSQNFESTCSFRPFHEWYHVRKWDCKCVSCGLTGSIIEQYDGYAGVDHHLSMLVDLEEIKPYRRAILKLYPAFADHPVFEDLV